MFKFAVKVLAEVAHEALTANRKTVADIDWLIPPGQYPDHGRDGAQARAAAVEVVSAGRPAREHVGVESTLALDVAVRDGRIREATRNARRRRRRLHVGLVFLRW